MRGGYRYLHEQIRGTGWDEKHVPTDRSSSHTHQGRTASSPDAAGTAHGIQTSLMKSQKPLRLTLAFPVSHRQHRETPARLPAQPELCAASSARTRRTAARALTGAVASQSADASRHVSVRTLSAGTNTAGNCADKREGSVQGRRMTFGVLIMAFPTDRDHAHMTRANTFETVRKVPPTSQPSSCARATDSSLGQIPEA